MEFKHGRKESYVVALSIFYLRSIWINKGYHIMGREYILVEPDNFLACFCQQLFSTHAWANLEGQARAPGNAQNSIFSWI